MRVDRCGRLLAALGIASLLALPALEASASSSSPNSASRQTTRQIALQRGGANVGRLECVPYARQVSGIDITGNAHTWWRQAEGRYVRGNAPEPGAVLVFRSSGGMRLGHVSVVSRVVSSRHILVEHANWPGPGFPKGRVARDVSMIDVSDRNDWTTVRVEIHGDRDGFGRHYPTYGFVLPRLENGAPLPPLNPITVARARLDERAARAAARPAGYVGRPAALTDVIASEIGDVAEPVTQLAAPVVARAAVAPASPAARPAAQPAAPVRVAMFTPRESLHDDDMVFGAPDRSLR